MDNLTFKEFSRRVIIFNEEKETQNLENINLQIIGAYYTEVMHRQDPKRLPPIKKFLITSTKKKKVEKPEEMLDKVKILNNLFGGKLIIND